MFATAGVAALCAAAAGGARAGSSVYYASPSSADPTGSCAASAPCRLDHAIALATAGDTVIVLPGSYAITYPLEASVAVTIEGAPGRPRPQLVGAPSLTSDTLAVSGGATVRDLDVEATNNTGAKTTALSIDGGTAENLSAIVIATDAQGEALSVKDSAGGTIIRTVLARSEASGGEAVSVKDSKTQPGSAALYNLTAVGDGASAEALSGNVVTGSVLVKNSILQGNDSDISTKPGTRPLSVSYSDFRPGNSSGYTDQGGNLPRAPLFVNAAGADFHEAAGSPTIDVGAADPALTASDLDGNPRSMGAAPDMGAYESAGTMLPPPSTPSAGVSVTARKSSGTIRVKLPHSRRYVLLATDAQVPVGSVIDASRGTVVLTSASDLTGGTKTGTFTGGGFLVNQPKAVHPTTQLRLVGGSLAACRRATSKRQSSRSVPYAPRFFLTASRVIRRLWGRDRGGRFRTIGRTASAAVRGTVWLTEDRCDGTLIRVSVGRVVVHDTQHHRTVLVRAGHSYLARG